MQDCQCKVCGNTQSDQVVIAKEMMFGFRDEFKYFKCSFCGCLQIIERPKDLSKYYPSENYYSYRPVVTPNSKKEKLKDFLRYALFNVYWHFKKTPLQNLPHVRNYRWLKVLPKIMKTSAILDVGCGNGHLLQQMSVWGFKNLTGIDPFIEKNILYPSGVRVWKADIYNYHQMQIHESMRLNESFELIMLHHTFEHLDNPCETLNQLYKMLSSEGIILIRIPVSDSFAWRKYGGDWFQIDAPRHFFLHTTKSMAILAKDCGLVLKQVIYDSTGTPFLYSEKYSRDIPLDANIEVSPSYLKKCEKLAKYLNKILDGDQACFVLEKQSKDT